jgi:UDP-2-acetamido-3-amino-2,3-dideoxy-glucuronate N-acetyltransferase
MLASASSQMVPPECGTASAGVAGVVLYRLPHFQDFRGLLSVAEAGDQIPFEVKRLFLVSGVGSTESRGEHAHITLRQMLICVNGSCEVIADDGETSQSFLLDDPSLAILLPPMIWLLVLASEKYDAADYIKDYGEFLQRVKARR